MKVKNVLTSDNFYKWASLMTKFTGYSFISIKFDQNGKSYIYRQKKDYVIFVLSLLFSLYIFYLSVTQKNNLELNSMIFNLGTNFLWKVSMSGIIVTKFINLFKGPTAMSIIVDLKWIDKKV